MSPSLAIVLALTWTLVCVGCEKRGESLTTFTQGATWTLDVNPRGLTPKDRLGIAAFVTNEVDRSGLDLTGWTVTVSAYPLTLPAPQANPFKPGQVITQATSYTDFGSRVLALSWTRGPSGTISVADLPYELENVRCGCESGLKGQ